MQPDFDRIVKAFNERLMIYRTKRDDQNPFGKELYNRQEALQYVIDAIEILAMEAGLAKVVPAENQDA